MSNYPVEFFSSSEFRELVNPIPPHRVSHVVLRYSLPYCLYFDDCGLIVSVNEKSSFVSLKMNVDSVVRGLPKGIEFPPNSRLKFDRWGRHAYTSVELSFSQSSWPDYSPSPNHSDNWLLYSLRFVNKLIDAYRHVGNEVLCDDVAYIDIIYYEMELIEYAEKTISRSQHFFPFDNSLIEGEAEFRISSDKQDYIHAVTKDEAVFSVDDDLVLKSEAHFRKGDYRLAVLFNAQSFEIFCRSLIRQGYIKLGSRTSENIETLLESSFANLARDHIRIACGFDFGSTNEFSNWNGRVRPIRNALAHGGRINIEYEQAFELINIIESAKLLLRGELSTEFFVPII